MVLTVLPKKESLFTSLEELIEEYFKEQSTGDTVCVRCKRKGTTVQKTELGKTPKYLVLSLKRHGQDTKNAPLQVPIELSLEPHVRVKNVQKSHLYILKGAGTHVGDTFNHGHWKACAIKNNQWIEYDDTVVTKVTQKYVCHFLNPDLLFFEKRAKVLPS